jgi:hypothetical protein
LKSFTNKNSAGFDLFRAMYSAAFFMVSPWAIAPCMRGTHHVTDVFIDGASGFSSGKYTPRVQDGTSNGYYRRRFAEFTPGQVVAIV